jgi:hypothetical protein
VGAAGVLSPKNPATVPAGASPLGVAIGADGKSLYVANQGNGTVSQYNVGAGGVLSSKNPAAVAVGSRPTGLAVAPDGSVLVTRLLEGEVTRYGTDAGGAISPGTAVTVGTGPAPFSVAVSPEIRPATGRAIRLARRPLRVGRRGAVAIGVSCPTRRDRCGVSVALRRLGSKAVIGRGRVRVVGGQPARARVKLSRRAFRLLRRRGRMRVSVAARALHAAGHRSRRQVTVRLLAPAKQPQGGERRDATGL